MVCLFRARILASRAGCRGLAAAPFDCPCAEGIPEREGDCFMTERNVQMEANGKLENRIVKLTDRVNEIGGADAESAKKAMEKKNVWKRTITTRIITNTRRTKFEKIKILFIEHETYQRDL